MNKINNIEKLLKLHELELKVFAETKTFRENEVYNRHNKLTKQLETITSTIKKIISLINVSSNNLNMFINQFNMIENQASQIENKQEIDSINDNLKNLDILFELTKKLQENLDKEMLGVANLETSIINYLEARNKTNQNLHNINEDYENINDSYTKTIDFLDSEIAEATKKVETSDFEFYKKVKEQCKNQFPIMYLYKNIDEKEYFCPSCGEALDASDANQLNSDGNVVCYSCHKIIYKGDVNGSN